MYAVCPKCGLEASIDITGHNRHRMSYSALECRNLHEKVRREGRTDFKDECPDLERAVTAAVQQFRRRFG
jgi:hypothetical protein